MKTAVGESFRFVELANDINRHMPVYVVERIVEVLNEQRQSVNGSQILLLGMAYKRNTGDARESPALPIAERLLSLGAGVSAVDPHVTVDGLDARIRSAALTREELGRADLVVIVTDHDSFDLVAEHSALILDTRRRLNGAREAPVVIPTRIHSGTCGSDQLPSSSRRAAEKRVVKDLPIDSGHGV